MYISTRLVAKAINYYEELGYKPIDVPLLVDQDVSEHTKPEGVPELHHLKDKVYVASAEQSFLQLHTEGKLPDGMYQAITPCYRHERFLGDTHYLMFLKLELIVVGLYKLNPLHKMIADCHTFFKEELDSKVTMEGNIAFGDELDLTCQGVELGSYGCRTTLSGLPYYYGTGVAMPRIDYVKSLISEERNK